jgi:hypothetical protein
MFWGIGEDGMRLNNSWEERFSVVSKSLDSQ